MTRPKAILLDAMGTLVWLEHPGPHLQRELRERFGMEVSEEQARQAVRAEIRHYRANLHLGRDVESLAELRRACATAMLDHLPPEAAQVGLGPLTDALVASIRFQPYPEAVETLAALRARGIRLAVLSNWDVALHETLTTTRIDELVEAAVSSAEVGIAKPEPGIFEHLLGRMGVGADEAWHVGDSPEADVAGAQAAGLRPILVWREDDTPPATGAHVIRDLSELVTMVA